MKKFNVSLVLGVAICAACFVHAAFAEEVDPEYGPTITIKGKGRLAIADAGGSEAKPLQAVADAIANFMMIDVGVEKGVWTFAGASEALKATKATAAVFVVKDKSLPISLIAMEARWGIVNAEGMSVEQVEKETLRVALVLLGAASSKYAASVMRPAFSLADIDKAGKSMTVDSLMAIMPNLEANGFTCQRTLTYREACEEGVAPAPKTDLEKKIAAAVKAELEKASK